MLQLYAILYSPHYIALHFLYLGVAICVSLDRNGTADDVFDQTHDCTVCVYRDLPDERKAVEVFCLFVLCFFCPQ